LATPFMESDLPAGFLPAEVVAVERDSRARVQALDVGIDIVDCLRGGVGAIEVELWPATMPPTIEPASRQRSPRWMGQLTGTLAQLYPFASRSMQHSDGDTVAKEDFRYKLAYYVFGTDADAAEHFEHGEFGWHRSMAQRFRLRTPAPGPAPPPGTPCRSIGRAFMPTDFRYPAWSVGGWGPVVGPWGWTHCNVLAGNIEIAVHSQYALRGPDTQRRADEYASSLAQGAVTHLERVKAAVGV
jgi:hypothetical protein